ncbi:MAG: divergent PAP2 family protein [Clostridia bacterium]
MIFENYYIIIPLLSWVIAQLIKVVIESLKDKKFHYARFIGNGGMPSGHAAIVASLSTAVLINEGIYSVLFGVTLIFSLIILADAIGVRYETGRQAEAINEIIEDMNKTGVRIKAKKLKEKIGHKPTEMFAGSILGVVVAYIIISFNLL